MRRLLHSALRPTVHLNDLNPRLLRRTFIPSPVSSASTSNLIGLLRAEITYLTSQRPPRPPPEIFTPFWIDDRPGQQWIRLISHHAAGREEVKVDATMFDAVVPVSNRPGDQGDLRRHISLVVEVTKSDSPDAFLTFICSAWPDYLKVNKVFILMRRAAAIRPYMGHDFSKLDTKIQCAVNEYLEERGVDDGLAEFLHEYMTNKDKAELARWMGSVESYVER